MSDNVKIGIVNNSNIERSVSIRRSKYDIQKTIYGKQKIPSSAGSSSMITVGPKSVKTISFNFKDTGIWKVEARDEFESVEKDIVIR